MLDEEVDEKFYLKEEQTERLIQNSDYLQDLVNEPKINILAHRKNYRRNTQVFDPNGITETLDTGQGGGRGHYTIGVKMNRNGVKGEQDIARTLLARDYKGFGNQDMNGVVIAASRGRNPENPSDRTVGSPTAQRLEVNKQGISNTITTVQKDNLVVERANGKNVVINKLPTDSDGIDFVGYLEGNKRIKNPTEDQLKLSRTHRQPNRIHSDYGIHPALSASEVSGRYNIMGDSTEFRIRKLTPLECWRLMGISDEDFYKAESVNSNSQLYKQAGNAIIVPVLEGIFSKLFKSKDD